jgi:pyridoxamine 5'-phosphate oxidase
MTNDSHHPDDLPAILAQCWQLLARGVTDRRFGFHHPTVANIDQQGRPRARVVILRASGDGTLRFHTDVRSQKWRELAAKPAISMVFYDEDEKIQLRVDGVVKLHVDDERARAAWSSTQTMSKVCYGSLPGPGVVIESHDAFTLPPPNDEVALSMGQASFGVVVVHVRTIEWLYLKVRNNRRALFDIETNEAKWLVP